MMRAEQDYGVKVIRAYQQFSEGFVMYPPAMLRERLVKLGWVRPVTKEEYNASLASDRGFVAPPRDLAPSAATEMPRGRRKINQRALGI